MASTKTGDAAMAAAREAPPAPAGKGAPQRTTNFLGIIKSCAGNVNPRLKPAMPSLEAIRASPHYPVVCTPGRAACRRGSGMLGDRRSVPRARAWSRQQQNRAHNRLHMAWCQRPKHEASDPAVWAHRCTPSPSPAPRCARRPQPDERHLQRQQRPHAGDCPQRWNHRVGK